MKIILWAVLYCLFAPCSAIASEKLNIDLILEKANSVRSSTPEQSIKLLSTLDSETLSRQQLELFRFLQAFNLLMSGKNTEATEKLEKLAISAESINVKLRSLASLLNVYAGLKDWDNAFRVLKKLEIPSSSVNDLELLSNINNAKLSFYNNIEYFELVKSTAEEILNSNISSRSRCSVLGKKLYAQLYLEDKTLQVSDFENAANLCQSINEPILKNVIVATWADFYTKTSQPEKSIDLILNYIESVKSNNFDSLTSYYLALLVEAYEKNNDWNGAEKYSNEIINNYSINDYYFPHLTAFKALYKINKSRENPKESLYFLEEYKELEQRDYNDKLAGKMAIEKAKLERNSELMLLNQQNKLLSTEAELAAANDRNKNLLLLVATILLAIALFWIYKNRQTHKQLRKIAETDALTGIYNRNHFTQCAEVSLAYCKKTQQNVSFIVFDLDYFKRVNDNYGHLVGDWALIQATKAVKQVCRANDIIGRMGGEEFAILLPNCAKDKAIEIAEVCRKQIAAIDTCETGHTFELTASFGVSHSSQADYNLDKLFACADNALYQSKDAGRNRVYSFQQSSSVLNTSINSPAGASLTN